jgi:hypothetical protein
MDVPSSPEKEARLRHVAEYDARFIEAVEEGRAAARRGELLEHDEVVARVEGMFQSCPHFRQNSDSSGP